MKRVLLAGACAAFCVPVFAQPTAAEVAFIYELNRARANPQAYDTANSLGGILNGVAAQPPLAINLDLCESARVHSDDMAANSYFAHTSPGLGQPNSMAINAGYPLPYPSGGNNIESLACNYSTAGSISYAGPDALRSLIIDLNVTPPGHRIHLLAMEAFWQTHREIGTGYATGNAPTNSVPPPSGGGSWNSGAYWTIHTAERTGTDPVRIVGVVYSDTNGNNRYDLGEGLAGVTVSATGPGSVNTTTMIGGMYVLDVSAGTWNMTCSGGAFSGSSTATVVVGSANVEVDFRSGTATGEVGFSSIAGGGPGPGGGGGGGGDSDSGGGGCALAPESAPMGLRWFALLLALTALVGVYTRLARQPQRM